MKKLLVGMAAGMVLMGVLVIGPLSPATANGQEAGEDKLLDADIAGTFRESLITPLQTAGEEIRDADLKRFYKKLVSAYHLEDIPETDIDSDDPQLEKLLPDIKVINEAALSLPLREAGKNIRDPEIASFYYDYLERAGWDISPNGQEAAE